MATLVPPVLSLPRTPIDLSTFPTLPPRLAGLATLAFNVAWSWNREARLLFRDIDETLWHRLRHNPIIFLRTVDPVRLAEKLTDEAFLRRYDAVVQWNLSEASDQNTWFAKTYPDLRERPIAYFCAEFGLHNSIPIYSGGLGVLAGDHLKTASDLGLPLIAVGILYRNGYFDQRIRPDGWQEDSDDGFQLDSVPLEAIPGPDGAPHLTVVRCFGRDVHIRAFRLQVGRVPVILLDTDLESNHPDDRPLLSKLYAGGPALRLRQEWLLGVGGVRVLQALGVDPAVWHANEGHAAFMMVERVRQLCVEGMSFADAVHAVRGASVFTTHTPVPAGHDMFGNQQVIECTGPVWEDMGISSQEFLHLGEFTHSGASTFHMTACSVRLARRINGVAERHGIVSRELWKDLWPGREAHDVPIGHVTNGVHLATWMANPMMQLLDRQLGGGWGATDEDAVWRKVLQLDNAALWSVHLRLKQTLFRLIREEARRAFTKRRLETAQLVGAGTLLDPQVFTIGFARRFATYKRADLIFRDVERLRALVTNSARPVQIIFAGKAHPADTPGKQVLQRVYEFTRDPRFEGRITFVEDYGMHLAHLLVQGVDMWMNMPRVPMEASGTSGMKAALNGVPQLSTVDGWWEEGYDGTNGWAIPAAVDGDDGVGTAEALYTLLEQEVVPRYYERDAQDIPLRWLETMKHAIRVAGSTFTARRMLEQYVRAYYAPAIMGDAFPDDPPTG